MRYERRSNSDGSSYYRFTFYDSKLQKQTHLTKAEIRKRFGKDVVTKDEAEECLKLLSAKYESEKIKIQRRLAWMEKFYSFQKLIDDYEIKQKKRAPNSWENNVFYIKHYVFHYFLVKQQLNLIDLWVDHFEKFYDWLATAKKIRGKGNIAVSSRNHAIKSLNTFLDHLEREKVITFTQRCPSYPEYMINSRTIDDVVEPHEMEAVYDELQDSGHEVESVFYRFLYFSGMRLREAKAISVADLFQGEIPSDFMRKKMTAYSIEYFGYIVAEGQLGSVDSNGKVMRKPFKGRKKIEEKYNRVLPIIDKILWNRLVDLAEKAFRKKTKSQTAKDCLLFTGIEDTGSGARLHDAYQSRKLRWRTWHCLRHSRATYLIGETSDSMLARVWLGHSSPRTIEKYNHLYQAITRAAKTEANFGQGFNLKKV